MEESDKPSDKPSGGPEEPGNPERSPGNRRASEKPSPFAPAAWIALILLGLVALIYAQAVAAGRVEIAYSRFIHELETGNIAELEIVSQEAYGRFRKAPLAELARKSKAPVDPPNAGEMERPEAASLEAPPLGQKPAEGPAEKEAGDAEPSPAEKQEQAPRSEQDLSTKARRLPEAFVVTLPTAEPQEELLKKLQARGVDCRIRRPFDIDPLLTFFWLILLGVMAASMWSMWRRTRDPLSGSGMLGSVVRSPAKRFDGEDAPKVTFDDVAGLKGAKRDLLEIVEFLRDPAKFQRLGAQPPKGVLLNGPPGTGKTLLAKAVAGEAGAPFFSVNGSEFIQLFVGVGASRVRDLFKTARKAAPSIVFIDEIDAVGRQRGAGLGGGHDEREQTLNQFLSEMDGFAPSETVVVIAATNRPDVLDPALLRPGRFDRHITIDRPTIEGREQLFEVHTRKVPVAHDVNFTELAKATIGLTGADIKNLVNEAALWATRHDKQAVGREDFEYARDKVLMGDLREEVLNDHQRRVTAYHESGHALVAWLMPSGQRLHKVTILPRGRALGVTQLAPDQEIHNVSKHELDAMLAMALAGRAAEKLIFDELTVGAESDLKRATQTARRMVTQWGMSDRLGPVSYANSDENPFLGREIVQHERHYSEHTAQIIDDEVAKVLHTAADRARRLLIDNRNLLDLMAEALLEREELSAAEIEDLIGPSPRSVGAAPNQSATISPAGALNQRLADS